VALEIRRVRVRDGFRVLDVKIERILSAGSFVHGALLYAAPTLNGIPRHRECARILDADIRLQHIAIIDYAKPLDNMEFFRVRRAEIIDIGLVVDADRIDHESIAFVVPDGLAGPARLDVREVLRINPVFTIESSKRFLVYKDPKDLEHYIDGMSKARLPEA
jgi:hypothetical protein